MIRDRGGVYGERSHMSPCPDQFVTSHPLARKIWAPAGKNYYWGTCLAVRRGVASLWRWGKINDPIQWPGRTRRKQAIYAQGHKSRDFTPLPRSVPILALQRSAEELATALYCGVGSGVIPLTRHLIASAHFSSHGYGPVWGVRRRRQPVARFCK